MSHSPNTDDFDARAQALFRELDEYTFDEVTPMPAHEVRRLGNRRRHRRHAGIAGAALGASLVAGAVFVNRPATTPPTIEVAAPSQSSSHSPSASTTPSLPTVGQTPSRLPTQQTSNTVPTPSTSATSAPPTPAGDTSTPAASSATSSAPSTSPTTGTTPDTPAPTGHSAKPVTTALLPGTDLIYWSQPGDLQQTAQYSGNETWSQRQSPLSYCEQGKADLGQRNVVWREYSGVGSGFATVVIFDFDTEQQATKGRKAMRNWYSTCKARQIDANGQVGAVSTATQLNVDGPNLADTTPDVSHRQVKWSEEGASDFMWEDVTIFSTGNRLMAVVQVVHAPEIGCSVPAKDGQRLCSTAAQASSLANRLGS